MPLDLTPIRCLSDNYAWLVHGAGQTALIDAPEAGPILAALEQAGCGLDAVLLTHHHDDHIQAVDEIVTATGARVLGNGRDAHRLPPLDRACTAGESLLLCGEELQVIDVSGHTLGQVAYHFPGSKLAFTADSLMSLGCGRIFEGDAAMMWQSLSRLNALPGDTLICSGHDYCAANGAFALSVEPGNAALKHRLAETAAGRRACSPSLLSEERTTNPFLRIAPLRTPLGMEGATDAEVFARLRAMKDRF